MPKVQPATATITWYDVKSVARISGLSLDMINYLCRYSIVTPSGSKDRGRGTVRKYTYTDILLLRVIAKLLEQGISVLRLRKCLAMLQKRGGKAAELATKKFVATDGYDIFFEDNKVLQLLSSGQMAFAFVVELTGLRKEVSARIAHEQKKSA